MRIRSAKPEDAEAILRVILPAIRAGETYALESSMSESDAVAYWLGADRETFVLEASGHAGEPSEILGTYYLRANQLGGGAHIANCGYMTRPDAAGRGIARAMCQHSLDHARKLGYRGMQFNFVVSSNERAVALWLSFGFQIVGRLPGAFQHGSLGFVDAFVMFRSL